MTGAPEGPAPGRIVARYVTGGFLSPRIRRIAELSSIDLRPGLPRKGEWVAVWGHARTSRRAEAVAAGRGAPVLRFEDAFLRSLHPGRTGGRADGPLGLVIDRRAAHFDARRPSDLETLLATHPFDDGDLEARARAAMAEMVAAGVTKYAATRSDLAPPDPGYVLVVDQTRGDASIAFGGASADTFREMLQIARAENPGARVVVKTHPAGAGHYTEADAVHGTTLEARPLPPATLFTGATRTYTVSSQLGFEAILHGHRPVTFGQPFWSGWGLDDARWPVDRRQRKLTQTQLFTGALLLYPRWYDPHRDCLCDAIDVIRILEARARAWREDREGWSAPGLQLWKRAPVRRFLSGRVTYRADPARRPLAWGMAQAPAKATRIEDGFLRSRGLGADLVPPLSLVLDGRGLYYDPARPSDLETAITQAATLPPEALTRARDLRRRIVALGLSKYNLGVGAPALPDRRVILVPGQVADDASIRFGTSGVADNAALLAAARRANPDAFLVYKPHPDVEIGLRDGAIDASEADLVAVRADPVALIAAADEVWTMTSLTGFEALLRDVPVVTLGAPFYAGWGLTRDLGRIPPRRRARPSLDALVHATLIAYPRYFDPLTGTACPPEVAVHRLAHGPIPHPGRINRTMAATQRMLAGRARLWR